MPQVFSQRADLLVKLVLAVPAMVMIALAVAGFVYRDARWRSKGGVPVSQPVMFSHAHHAGGLGIDCQYCHTGPQESAIAGIPSAETCMNCHSQLYTDAEMLAPIRESWRAAVALSWNRVNDTPDFVFFNHAVHVGSGFSCQQCHGQVDAMPLMSKAHTMDMRWCLECHRAHQPIEADGTAPQLVLEPNEPATKLTNCSACHR